MVRFTVAKMWDLNSRAGLLAAGWLVGGTLGEGTVLESPDGAATTVLGIEFESPQDRRTGQITLLLERTNPSPVVADTTLAAVAFEYVLVFKAEERTPPPLTVMVAEVTLGPTRAVLYQQAEERWAFNPDLGARVLFDDRYVDRTQTVSRAEAEELCGMMGIALPSERDLRDLMLSGEADLLER